MKLYAKLRKAQMRAVLETEIKRVSDLPQDEVSEDSNFNSDGTPKPLVFEDEDTLDDNPIWWLTDLIALRNKLDEEVRNYGRVFIDERTNTALAAVEVSLMFKKRPKRSDLRRLGRIRG